MTAPLVRRMGRPPALPQAQRDAWWAYRVTHVAAGFSAIPRFIGRLADLLPLQNTIGTAVQAVVVLGVLHPRFSGVAPRGTAGAGTAARVGGVGSGLGGCPA